MNAPARVIILKYQNSIIPVQLTTTNGIPDIIYLDPIPFVIKSRKDPLTFNDPIYVDSPLLSPNLDNFPTFKLCQNTMTKEHFPESSLSSTTSIESEECDSDNTLFLNSDSESQN